jgi:hypothetical protein
VADRNSIADRGQEERQEPIFIYSVYHVFNNHKNCSGDIKKAIVIYFTLMRFVNELFALLSGLSKDVVPGYFEQSISTIYGLESGMSMDFLSIFASNV